MKADLTAVMAKYIGECGEIDHFVSGQHVVLRALFDKSRLLHTVVFWEEFVQGCQ